MQTQELATPSLAGKLAEDLLKAWIAREQLTVRRELESSISIPMEGCDGGEAERRELLKAVAIRMRARRDAPLLDAPGADLELCMKLLVHIVELQSDLCPGVN